MPRRNRPPRMDRAFRYQPQTGMVGRCVVCHHLYDRVPDDDGELCYSCRAQPGLFPIVEAK